MILEYNKLTKAYYGYIKKEVTSPLCIKEINNNILLHINEDTKELQWIGIYDFPSVRWYYLKKGIILITQTQICNFFELIYNLYIEIYKVEV